MQQSCSAPVCSVLSNLDSISTRFWSVHNFADMRAVVHNMLHFVGNVLHSPPPELV